jgi:tetratricopeptide (TPR) repeat protein
LEGQSFQEFEQAIELNPDYWKAIHNRGVSLALAGDLEAGLKDFSRVVILKPGYANGWFNRAEIYYEQEKFELAANDYSRALALDNRDADTFIRRGHSYFQLGKFQEALNDYNQAVQIDDRNIEALVNRADANRSLGLWQRSADDYRRAIALDSNSGRAYQGAAWLLATCPDANVRDGGLAIRAAEQALKLLGENDISALDAMAAARATNGQFEEAAQLLQKAVDAASGDEVATLQKRLDMYQNRQPYRDKP